MVVLHHYNCIMVKDDVFVKHVISSTMLFVNVSKIAYL